MTTSVAVRTAVEMLSFEPQSVRSRSWFSALAHAAPDAGIEVMVTQVYRAAAPILLLWGPGAPARGALMRRHVAAGGHCIAIDLAYWNRDAKVRVTIDAAHPQAWVMRREWPRSRFVEDPAPVSNVWNQNGPIIVAGIGRKARTQYGDPVLTWEAQMIAACQRRWPGRSVTYRKKQTDAPAPDGAVMAAGGPIDRVLAGASLVVTWHSNVAVDAIRLGIPVICRDGAAAAVCPSEMSPDHDPKPLPEALRDRFIWNLAWFQWGHTPSEALGCWTFLRELLSHE